MLRMGRAELTPLLEAPTIGVCAVPPCCSAENRAIVGRKADGSQVEYVRLGEVKK
jgi:hypothetical protein